MPSELITYLDNAATTYPKPESVYREMDHFYRHFGGNAGRGANPLALRANMLLEEVRNALQRLFQAREVVFAPSATLALNTVILGALLRPGDVVYASPFEHNAILRPLEHLRKTRGVRVETLPFDRHTLRCDLGETERLFRLEPPAMVCTTLVSNVLGIRLPVEAIAQAAKRIAPSSVVLVDGAQAAGLLELDTSYVDALVFSGHKAFYGPYGIAGIAFYSPWRPEPIFFGGTGTHSESLTLPPRGSARFEVGSQNVLALAGLHAALQWLHQSGRANVLAHTRALTQVLVEALRKIDGVRVWFSFAPEQHLGIVSFVVKSAPPQAVESALGAHGIAVRAGLHCAPWTHRFLGTLETGGTVRVSVGYFNTEKDIAHLMDVLRSFS